MSATTATPTLLARRSMMDVGRARGKKKNKEEKRAKSQASVWVKQTEMKSAPDAVSDKELARSMSRVYSMVRK